MPRVPQYEGLRASPSVQPQVQVAAPDTSAIGEVAARQGEALSQGLMQAGSAASRIAVDMQRDANQVRINDGMNSLVKARTALQVDLLAQKGKNALQRESGKPLVDEYDERLNAEIETLSMGLGNEAQRAQFKAQADQMRNDFRARATQHMVQEQGEYRKQTRLDTIATGQSQYVTLYGDPALREQAQGAIVASVDEFAQEEGWDQTTRDLKLAEAMTPAHAGVIKSLIQSGRASDAQDYYDANSMGMTLQGRASVLEPLQRAVVAQEADDGAALIWMQAGPKGVNDAIKIFDMEQLARQQFAGQPDKITAVVSNLRNLAQGWNAQQAEVKASHVSGVWKLHDDGASLSQIRRSDAYLALDETAQHEFEQRLQTEATARESRALTADQRELTRLQIKERLADIRGTEAYLTAMDPNVLSRMSRAQVEAMRSTVGKDQTEALLAKWDALKKPGALPIAKMDDNDFKAVAASMGLDPFEKKASPESKAALAQVRMDVETIITERERAGGKPLTREERNSVMRKAVAAQVMLGRTFGSDVPVSAAFVSQDDLAKVVIPQDQKALIAEAMAVLYERDPSNPLYTPTPDNMARMYLQRRMREGNQ